MEKKYGHVSKDKIVVLKRDGIPHLMIKLIMKNGATTKEQFDEALADYKDSSRRSILSELTTSGILHREPAKYTLEEKIEIKVIKKRFRRHWS